MKKHKQLNFDGNTFTDHIVFELLSDAIPENFLSYNNTNSALHYFKQTELLVTNEIEKFFS